MNMMVQIWCLSASYSGISRGFYTWQAIVEGEICTWTHACSGKVIDVHLAWSVLHLVQIDRAQIFPVTSKIWTDFNKDFFSTYTNPFAFLSFCLFGSYVLFTKSKLFYLKLNGLDLNVERFLHWLVCFVNVCSFGKLDSYFYFI